MTADEAWDEIMRLAKEHAMILQAYGGTALLVHPDAQEQSGIREKCVEMNAPPSEHRGSRSAVA